MYRGQWRKINLKLQRLYDTLKKNKDQKEMFAISNLLAAACMILHNTLYNVVGRSRQGRGHWEKTLDIHYHACFKVYPTFLSISSTEHERCSVEGLICGPSPCLVKCNVKKVNEEIKCKFWAAIYWVTWATNHYEFLLFGSDISVYFLPKKPIRRCSLHYC